MRLLFAFFIMTFSFVSIASVGKVLKSLEPEDAFILRGGNKLPLSPAMNLELGDEIVTTESSLLIHLYPLTQVSLAKNTQIKIADYLTEGKKFTSAVNFVKGQIRLQVLKEKNFEVEQKVQAEGVAFTVQGTELEVSLDSEANVDLDVFTGEVIVSSPHVQTFVPEIVKAKEGFRFLAKEKSFSRRKFSPKFKNHPEFEKRKKIVDQWKRSRT